MQMEPTEGYEVIGYIPAKSLLYNQPGICYTLVALSEEDPTAGKQLVLVDSHSPQINHNVFPTSSAPCPSHLL